MLNKILQALSGESNESKGDQGAGSIVQGKNRFAPLHDEQPAEEGIISLITERSAGRRTRKLRCKRKRVRNTIMQLEFRSEETDRFKRRFTFPSTFIFKQLPLRYYNSVDFVDSHPKFMNLENTFSFLTERRSC